MWRAVEVVCCFLVDELPCDPDPKADAYAEKGRKAGETQGGKSLKLE